MDKKKQVIEDVDVEWTSIDSSDMALKMKIFKIDKALSQVVKDNRGIDQQQLQELNFCQYLQSLVWLNRHDI